MRMVTLWGSPNIMGARRALLVWAADHLREYPWRCGGLSLYEAVVAEVLLKRTTARAAARVYATFIDRYPDFRTIWSTPTEEVEEALVPIGLYRQRARGLKVMADYILRVHGGRVPGDLSDLLQVPHLGPYSARAVLSFGHGQPAAVVDSNVQRVLGRLCRCSLGEAPSLSAVQELADHFLDPECHQVFNWALLDLGAIVCRYDRPRCPACPLVSLCDYANLGRPAESNVTVQS